MLNLVIGKLGHSIDLLLRESKLVLHMRLKFLNNELDSPLFQLLLHQETTGFDL